MKITIGILILSVFISGLGGCKDDYESRQRTQQPQQLGDDFYSRAAAGDVNAMHALGDQARNRGEHQESVKWYRAAAERGNTFSMHNLASRYSGGIGVRKDLTLAYVWNSLAISLHYGMLPPVFLTLDEQLVKQLTPDDMKRVDRITIRLLKRIKTNKKEQGGIGVILEGPTG